MHADLYRALGLDARYLPIDTDDLDALERLRPHLPLEAIGVTAPHKEAAARRCAALDAEARDAGAVNTVRFDGPSWSGSNTDASGLRRLLGSRGGVAGARAVVIGAGGTGRTAARVLLDAGAAVTLVNRTDGRARDVAAAIGASFVSWSERESVEAEIRVLAVPDEARDGSPWTDDPRRSRLVIDYAYGPRETGAATRARAAGVDVLDGLDLLAAQGADQFRLMTGAAPDESRMRATAATWLQHAG
jgi:shikimate 5-dehydrogenase